MQTFFKHEMETASEYRTRKKGERKTEEAKCYAEVNFRDGNCSRYSGAFLVAGDADDRRRREHHHMEQRAFTKRHETHNVILLSGAEHAEVKAGKRRYSGDADLRDLDGKLCGVKVERITENGWEVEKWV